MRQMIPLAVMVTAVAAALGGAGSVSGAARTSASTRATAVAAGLGHTCVLTRAGGVECWGYNGHDELGTGKGDSLVGSSRPLAVSGLRTGIVAISAGVRHSCALTSAGGVKCWGYNRGALGDGTSQRRFVPVDVVGLSEGVAAIAAGLDYSCALTGAGDVECWGSNQAGQLGDGTTTDRLAPVGVLGLGNGIRAIAAGARASCAVTSGGSVECWGASFGLTPVPVPGLTNITAITIGGPSCALNDAGAVKCWGGDYGATPVPISGLGRGVTAISASGGHSCALTSRGVVKCWGLNDHGQLGDGTRVDRKTPVRVVGLSGAARAISTGAFHSCAVTRVGDVECWGANGSGQLGDGTHRRRLTPVGVVGFANASLAVVSPIVRVTPGRVAPVTLRCSTAARCRGRLTLATAAGLPLGSTRFSLAPGRTGSVGVRLTGRGFSLLVRTGRLQALARVRYLQPGGGSTTAATRITLTAP